MLAVIKVLLYKILHVIHVTTKLFEYESVMGKLLLGSCIMCQMLP